MIPRKSKADTELIKKVFTEGSVYHFPLFSVRTLKSGVARYSIIVPSSVAPSAVKRVALKRKAYRALASVGPLQHTHTVVFILKSAGKEESVQNIESSMRRVLESLN